MPTSSFWKRTTVLSLAVLLMLAMASGCAPQEDEEEEADAAGNGETLYFAELGWESAQFHNRVAQFIIEHGYGYDTDGIPGETIPLFTGLRQGDLDINMEVWIQNQQEAYDEGIESGEVIDLGTNFDDNVQGMFVPTYVVEGDPERDIEPMAPDLETIEDLPDYWELFEDPEDPTKGRFYGGVPGWEADEIMTEKFATYGLDEYYNIFRPGSGAALASSLVSAYEAGEPWFGYYWGPTWIFGKLDLTQIEEPAYDEEQWEEDYGTAFPPVDVNIVVNHELPDRAPEVVDFLSLYETNMEMTSEALAYMETESVEADAAAVWFLNEYEETWTEWVPEEVADKVRAAL